ncbi:uncharacterized protein LOC111455306 isoform X1 [Cucurbita moschata]|uniref:Uncharacterized protein LOC111455306 isoform X1 n=1 Tax=Cucurbita moschata TaxID=3662 RepID=A0A6J1GLA6_CUCMO|nr:uncharacterized protein LOC111455306 isoform X1 [Cucurbita moschata]
MASKDPEEAANTATEEGSLAFKKKRARRVSFADVEITSVHIFKRDEDYETPLEPQATPEAAPPDNEVLGFFRNLVDSDDSLESSPNLDDDVLGQRKSFLRPLGSPSPGSISAGSATSNDEDNFFGPVAANFIRPRRLSDSAASDDNHDVTMDSTAFSMHFRSLAESDSGRELKTPTAIRSAFGERTPTRNTMPTNSDSFMTLTMADKLILPSSQSGDLVRSEDSNAMSIVGENSNKYDYGRLSPSFDALLTEGSRELYTVSVDEKLSKQIETREVDQIGQRKYDMEICERTEMEAVSKGINQYAKQGVEESILNNVTPHEVFQSNGLLQRKLSDGWAKEDFLIDKRPETPRSVDYKLKNISPQKRSFSAEQKTSLATSNSPSFSALVTPNSKLSNYRLSTGSMKFGMGLSSKQRSIPKFSLPEPSPCVSSIKEEIGRLKSRLSSYSSMVNLSGQPERCKDLESKYIDIPAVRLEEQLSRLNGNNGEFESSFSTSGSVVKPSKDFPRLSQSEEPKGFTDAGETPGYMAMANFSNMQPSEPAIELKSPAQATWTEKKDLMQHILISEDHLSRSSTSIKIDDVTDIGPDDREQNDSTSIHDTLVSSPLRSPDVRLLGNIECPSGSFGELKQCDLQVKHVSACLTQGQAAAADTSNTSPLTKIADNSSSLQSKSGAVSASPFLKGQSWVDGDDNGVNLSNLQNNFVTSKNLQLSSRDGNILNSRLESPAKSSSPQFQKPWTSERSIMQSPINGMANYSPRRIISTQTSSGKKEPKVSISCMSTPSPFKNERTQSSAREKPFQSPFRNDPFNETKDDGTFMRKVRASPTSSLSGHINHDNYQASHILVSSSRKTNHRLSGSKRRNIDLITLDGDQGDNDVIVRTQRSLKLNHSGSCNVGSPLEESNQISNGSKRTEGNTLMHWTDMAIKFLAETNDLLPPSINKLNAKAIERLEDTLVHLLKVKEYELLCSEIQSQKVIGNLGAIRKRVVEARSLVYKVAYQKAKLQLVCIKRDGYQNRAQSLNSHFEDFQMLKLNYDRLRKCGSKDSQVDDGNSLSCPIDSEASCDRASMIKHEIESLDGKIKGLSQYFSTYCDLKGVTSSTDILGLVIDHLRKRKLCRSIYQGLQMWKVDDFEKKNDHYTILLNYLSYAYQRITIKANPLPGVTILNTLNDTHIEKNFPEMNACCAFAFVINVEKTRKYNASWHLPKETQMMSSFLHNLLDVIAEMQIAQIEISNLILIRFYSPSDKKLDLQLSFINFQSGRKVNLVLDVSDLSRGIYPSEVLPHKVESPASNKYTLSESMLNDIRAAVGNLDSGYSRILRVCRCVSEVVQRSSS